MMSLQDNSIRLIRQECLASTPCIRLEVRELQGRDSVLPFRMIAIVVPGGWVSASLFDLAYEEIVAENHCVKARRVPGGGMDLRFLGRAVETTVHLTKPQCAEINDALDRLERSDLLEIPAASAAS